MEHSDFDFNQEREIDHIFPVQAFVDHKIYDMKIINHLTNLRPLSKVDNNKKADNYDEDSFLQWLESIGYFN